MRLEIVNSRPGRVLWTGDDGAIAAQGYQLRQYSDGKDTRLGTVSASALEHGLAASRLSRQALRLGVHNLWRLADGGILAVLKKRIFKRGAAERSFRLVESIHIGNKPAFGGVHVCPDGTVFYGEYSLNWDRSLPISLYRSDDNAESFHRIFEFVPGRVRHIHYIQWDPYADCLWMGTGDADAECMTMVSHDRGKSWDTVGSGSQMWRSVGVAFTRDAVFWGTDAGSDAGREPNYIIRWSREARQCERVNRLQGPCHGICVLQDGTLVATTGVEGGENEVDDRAHLWASKDGGDWTELASWRKDPFPGLVQYGVVHFAHRLEHGNVLHMTAFGLRGAGERTFVARVIHEADRADISGIAPGQGML